MNASTSFIYIFRDFIARYPRQFSLLVFLLIIEGLTAALSILAVVPLADFLLDATLKSPSFPSRLVLKEFHRLNIAASFWNFGALFVSLNFVKSLIAVAVRYSILLIKYDVLRGITADSLRKFFNARWEFFSQTDQGKLLNTMYREVGNIGDTVGYLATNFAQIIQLVIYLALPTWLNPTMTLTAIGLAILFGLPFLIFSGISYKLGRDNTSTANAYVGVINETFSAIRLIFGFGRQHQAQDRYLKTYDAHVAVTLRSQTLNAAVHSLFQPVAMLAVVIAMGMAIRDNAPVAELTAVMWSLLSAMPILAAILQGRISISSFLPSYEQLTSLSKSAAGLEEVAGSRYFSKIEKNIAIEKLTFTYPGRVETLVDVSFEFRKGEMTALVGESGSGKSTVADLVLGLQVPTQGSVLIDGIPLKDWNINSFRERVGYVPQDPQLFNSSIRDNLLWSFERASDFELWEALRLANAADFVRNFPKGIDTIVGDRGIRISGGQRQRIALARAVLRKPELLILDEATSALDSESELLIQQSIEQVARGTTILVVAHRLSTIAKANRVYVLSQGRIIEEGTFAALSTQSGGILHTMLRAQQQLQQSEKQELARC